MPDAEKVAAIRQLLPATGSGIYLNAGTCGPLPTETQRAMDEQAASELAVGRARIDQFVAFIDRMAEARASVAALLVADPDDIALTHSTTDGINLVLSSLPWERGDRVVTTNHEHPGVLGPLQALRERLGVEVELVDIGDGGDAERTLAGVPARARAAGAGPRRQPRAVDDRRRAARSPRSGRSRATPGRCRSSTAPSRRGRSRWCSTSWASTPTRCRARSGCWVPRAWARSGSAARSPTPRSRPAPGYLAYASFDRARGGTLRAGARRFEATGFHRPSVVGLARSVGWLSMYVGLPWAFERAARLAAWSVRPARRDPRRLDGHAARARRRRSSRSGSPAGPPPAAVAELGPRVFAIIRDLPPIDAIRISVGFWNTEEELERFAPRVELLAAHTPETIPPRRTLTVLGSDDQPIA